MVRTRDQAYQLFVFFFLKHNFLENYLSKGWITARI